MAEYSKSLSTDVVHAGEPQPRIDGAVAMPIFQTSTFVYRGETDYHDLRYVRLNNTPNHEALGRKLAAIENAEAAVVTASGMAAISTTLLALLKQGDHLLCVDCPYGGTRNLLTEDLPRYGIETSFIDPFEPADWEAKKRDSTRAIYVESITNPLMQVPELEAVVAFAREHGLVSLIDNTIASPINFRPAEHGFDLSLHSATKYLGGHSDLAAGVVIGRPALVDRMRRLLDHLGGTLDPHACFLLHRGMKTLDVRVRRQNENAARLARFLEEHPAVASVNYPGLVSDPGHQRAARLFDGFGGMLSFELTDGLEAAERMLTRLTIPIVAVSLGGVETLIIRPSISAYANVDPAEREKLGVREGLLRVSVGIESADDLVTDFDRALGA